MTDGTEIWLSAYNRARIENYPVEFDYTTLGGITGAVNGPHSEGDSVVNCDGDISTGDDPLNVVISIGGNSQPYFITAVAAGGGGTLDLTINPPLQEDVADNAVILVLPNYLVTDWVKDISDLEMKIEANQNQYITENQIDVTLANFDSEFYDRLTQAEAWSTVSAYFTTYNEQDEQNIKFLSVNIRPSDADSWQLVYVGSILRDRLSGIEPDGTIEFTCESIYTALRNITLSEVEGVYNGHWYNYYEPDRPTPTAQGRYLDLTVKIFHANGAPKSYLTITSTQKTDGYCKIGFDTDPLIQEGEIIEILRSDDEYDGRFRCEETSESGGVFYVYYTFGTNTVSVDTSNTTNGCIAHRVIMDPFDRYLSDTYDNIAYEFDSAFFFVPKWLKHRVEYEKTVLNILNEFCNQFTSFAFMDYIDGISYGFFRSRLSNGTAKKTLTSTDFIGKARGGGNWKFHSTEGVRVDGTVEYFNGESSDEGLNINGQQCVAIATADAVLYVLGFGISAVIKQGESRFGIYPSGNFQQGEYIQFSNHDQKYYIKTLSTIGSYPPTPVDSITVDPPLRVSVKGETIVSKYTSKSVDIEFASCFNVKLKYPTFWVCSIGNGSLYKLKGGETITDYAVSKVFNNGSKKRVLGFQYVPTLPYNYKNEIPCGEVGLISRYTTPTDGHVGYINLNRFPCTLGQNDFDEDDPFNVTNIYAEYVQGTDDNAHSDSTQLIIILHGGAYSLERASVELNNQGDINDKEFNGDDTPTPNQWDFGFSRLEYQAVRSTMAIDPDDYPKGGFINANLLNPEADNYFYWAIDEKLKKILVFDSGSITTIDTGAGEYRQYPTIKPRFGYAPLTYADAIANEIFESDDGDYTSFTSICGGGATSPALGASTSGANLSLDIKTTFFRGCVLMLYDDMVVISDDGNNKVILYDKKNDLAYCIQDSATLKIPGQISAKEFTQFFNSGFGIYFKDIIWKASETQNAFFSPKRRVFEANHEWSDLDNLSVTLGDRFVLDTTVCSSTGGGTAVWVTGKRLNFKTHEHELTYLENVEDEISMVLADIPTVEASDLLFSSVAEDTMDVDWTAGDSDYYLVLRSEDIPPDFIPVNGQSYEVGQVLGVGSSFVAYVGSATGFTDSSLTSYTNYYYTVYAFNGSGGTEHYLTSASVTDNQETQASEPDDQPSSIVFNVTGNTTLEVSYTLPESDGVIFIIRNAAAPTGTPTDFNDYDISDAIGDGTVAYIGEEDNFTVTGLTYGNTYYLKGFSFNGGGSNKNYKTGSPLSGSKTITISEPTNQPTNLSIVYNTGNDLWIISFVAADPPVGGYIAIDGTDAPVDGTTYAVDDVIGSSTVIYVGADTEFAVETDRPVDTHVYAYNGSSTHINYKQTAPLEEEIV